MLGKYAKLAFDVNPITSERMQAAISRYYRITDGQPDWVSEEDEISAYNMANFVDDYTAGLVCLDLGIELSGGKRAEYLQKQMDYLLQVIQDKVSDAVGNVGVVFKPNGETIDYVEPNDFMPIDHDSNGNITAMVFRSQIITADDVYTKLEYHRFQEVSMENETGEKIAEKVYRITNKAYKSKSPLSIGDPCELSEVEEWADIEDDVVVWNLEKPLFAYFKIPAPNRVDRKSPLGVAIWQDAIPELKAIDIALSRKNEEIVDSKHITFIPESSLKFAADEGYTMPRYIRGLNGANYGEDGQFHEHVASILTDERIADINANLSILATKCGFSQGTFQLDKKTGTVTATQIEADQQDTIRTIKNIRDALRRSIDDLLYALDRMADGYSNTRPEKWTVDYNFGDITYNWEEDRQHHYALAMQGRFPWWLYFVKFLGYSEEDAKKILAEAQAAAQPTDQWGEEE